MNRIVLFGATGYQGRLTAEALCARGLAPLLAGRNAARLAALAAELGGLEYAVADVADPASLRRLLSRGDVLVSTVGPFHRLGLPQIEAALERGAHYVDSCGESAFYRLLYERFLGRIAYPECAVLTACAYDFFPGNLAADLVLAHAGSAATRVDIGYFGELARGYAVSAGSQVSGLQTLLEPGLFFRNGQLQRAPIFTEVGYAAFSGAPRIGVSMAGTEHLFLPELHPSLRDIRSYWGWVNEGSRPLSLVARGLALVGAVPPVKRALSALLARAKQSDGSGPDENLRLRSSSYVSASAYDAEGRALAHVELGDVDGFSFTANILAWSADTILCGGLVRAGFTGPVQAFGRAALLRGHREAGFEILRADFDADHAAPVASSHAPAEVVG